MFKLVDGIFYNGTKECVVKAGAGISFSVVLTETGKGIVSLYIEPQAFNCSSHRATKFSLSEVDRMGNSAMVELASTSKQERV